MKVVTSIIFGISVFIAGAQVSQEELLKVSVNENSQFKETNKNKGYELFDITARYGSKKEKEEEVVEQIILREFVQDTLYVEVVTPANCCASFVCDLEVKDNGSLYLSFTKADQDCFCLSGIFLTYKIIVPDRKQVPIFLNGNELDYRKHDPNETRDVSEFYDNGQIKSIKMYLGDELKRVSHFDETGKRTKMILYNNGQMIEKTY